ncbi:MAG TPA: hypothetical protein DEQ02_04390 [Ruminococcaceae bacterium]|nr:hypothetical protein [Oscillospiraceae bacterium]
MDIMEILEQYWYVITAFAAVIVIAIIFNIVRIRRSRKSNENFLVKHPDAAKVYLTSKALVTSEAVNVYTVNGSEPERFFKGTKGGIYLIPGQSLVEISYSYTRPGVMYKNVTKSTGVVKKTLEVQANTAYILGFDRKAEEFTFEIFTEE